MVRPRLNVYECQTIISALEYARSGELNGIDWTESVLYDPAEVAAEIRARYGAIIAKIDPYGELSGPEPKEAVT